MAVDLGTGGPKAAVVSAAGRIVAHAFRAVGIDLTSDGGAEQSPQAWWDAIVASARRALADSGVAPANIGAFGRCRRAQLNYRTTPRPSNILRAPV